jgi:uncharacterized membrane protein
LPKAFTYLTTVLLPAFWAILKAIWPTFLFLANIIKDLITWLSQNTWVIWALVGAFVAFKTAMLITDTIKAIGTAFQVMSTVSTVAMAGVRGAYMALSSAVAVPMIMPAIAVAAALVSIVLVINALRNLNNELDRASRAQTIQSQSADAFWVSLRKARDEGRITQAEFLRRSAAFNGKALGGSVQANKPYMVGERGRELFVPNQSGTIIPNNNIEKMGQQTSNTSTTNINGDIYLQDKSAVDAFFTRINRNQELAQKGMATI